MTEPSDWDLQNAGQLFSAATGHVPMAMKRLTDARVVWINGRVPIARTSRAEAADGAGDEDLLARYAFVADVNGNPSLNAQDAPLGHADRYGGAGLANNGGSGRAVVLNGRHVKGIGRTPLIGAGTDEAHASGGAYLEEVVRESMLAEIAAAEFPWGAVRTRAIIDTGLRVVWDEDQGPRPERRCLMVRPAVLRPGHFERAIGHRSAHPNEGAADAERVAAMFRAVVDRWGAAQVVRTFDALAPRWAQQAAYGFVHRLTHGAYTSSNLALDGALLDFGAMRSLPSWARCSVMLGMPPTGDELHVLQAALASLGLAVDKALPPPSGMPAYAQRASAMARRAYHGTLRVEALRLAGLARAQARRVLEGPVGPRLVHEINRCVAHGRQEQIDLFEETPQPRLDWGFDQLWGAEPPQALRGLRDAIEAALSPSPAERDALRRRNALRARTRAELFSNTLKPTLYAQVERELEGERLTPQTLSALIDGYVLRNRRDSRHDPEDAVPLGFAVTADASYALFEPILGGEPFALREEPLAGEPTPAAQAQRLALSVLASESGLRMTDLGRR